MRSSSSSTERGVGRGGEKGAEGEGGGVGIWVVAGTNFQRQTDKKVEQTVEQYVQSNQKNFKSVGLCNP